VLAADFAANSLAMMALFWIVLGVSLGWAMNRPQTPAGG
jgi:predicted cobalt transporter CbtA